MASMTDLSQRTAPVRVALEPVYNVLNSFSLLNEVGKLPGLNSKIVQMAAAFSPEQLHANRLLFEGLRDALAPEQDGEEFSAFLKYLSEQNPDAVRDRALERLRARFIRRASSENTEGDLIAPDAARLLNDMQAYLACVKYAQETRPLTRRCIQRFIACSTTRPRCIQCWFPTLKRCGIWPLRRSGSACSDHCAGRLRCLHTIWMSKRQSVKFSPS